MKLWKKIRNLFRPKLILLENLSTEYYTHPVISKIRNRTGLKDIWYLANGIYFGNSELTKDKRVLLIDRNTEEIRITHLVAGGDFTGPVFDKHETLITHEILGIEI